MELVEHHGEFLIVTFDGSWKLIFLKTTNFQYKFCGAPKMTEMRKNGFRKSKTSILDLVFPSLAENY